MIAVVLCVGAFLLSLASAKRSLVAGLMAVITVGYFYGILRANVTSALSHFIFDAAVLGLYAVQLLRPLPVVERLRVQPLSPWLGALIGWPVLLLLMPNQDPMVRMVGLRAAVFFLPFVYLGARLDLEDLKRLTLWVAGLNLVVFAFALGEFFIGLERFYPRNEVTELIYRSNDVNTGTSIGGYRIPGTFGNSATYAGAMIITTPLLLGLWTQHAVRGWRQHLISAAMVASVLGVFMAASRSNFLVLVILLVVATFSGRLGATGLVAWAVLLGGIGWAVVATERLFTRFMTLGLDTFIERLSWGVNENLIRLLFEFPLGNGLGGGGTSMPYFLQPLIRNPIVVENQYGAIVVELGVPGLLIWLAFLGWVFTRRTTSRSDPWNLGRRLAWFGCAAYFGMGLIGVGTLTSVPFSVLLLLLVGWLSVRPPAPEILPPHEPPVHAPSAELQRWHA